MPLQPSTFLVDVFGATGAVVDPSPGLGAASTAPLASTTDDFLFSPSTATAFDCGAVAGFFVSGPSSLVALEPAVFLLVAILLA